MAAAALTTDNIVTGDTTIMTTISPSGCSFDGKHLIVNNQPLAFIYYKDTDEIWMPAKPVMKVTGEANINQFMDRVLDDDKMPFENLAEVKGVPSEGCYGFITPPNPADYNQGKAIWINESGFYKVLLSASKHKELCAKFQSWVCKEVLPSIRKTGSYGRQPTITVEMMGQIVAEVTTQVISKIGDILATKLDELIAAQKEDHHQVAARHGVLEITRSSVSSLQQDHLLSIGTKVDDSKLLTIGAEGGPLHMSVFLQEKGVRDDIIRRLTPTFSAEVGRRKLVEFEASDKTTPLWIAWSIGAWRPYYTEADRNLMTAVFDDPLTKQNIEILENSRQIPRVLPPHQLRRRQGPYSRVLRGGTEEVTRGSIVQFFGQSS